MKLALAAVEATDCAMDGTVSCAKRDEGRPARAGVEEEVTGAGSGAGAALAVGIAALAMVPGATVRATLGLETATSGLLTFTVVVFTESFNLSLTSTLLATSGAGAFSNA